MPEVTTSSLSFGMRVIANTLGKRFLADQEIRIQVEESNSETQQDKNTRLLLEANDLQVNHANLSSRFACKPPSSPYQKIIGSLEPMLEQKLQIPIAEALEGLPLVD